MQQIRFVEILNSIEITVMNALIDPIFAFTFTFDLNAAIALGAGILILVMPKLLNYVVAIYLIAIGVLGLLG